MLDYQMIDALLREYWTFIVAALLLCYFGARQLKGALEDRAGGQAAAAVTAAASAEERAEAIRIAREKQQAYVAEQTKKDAELRKERQHRELEERARKAEEIRNARASKQSGTAGDDGPLSRLPRLPGGSRDSYQPSTQQGGNSGGGYRPSNPNICKLKRGG
jgi:hypothetical protein